MTEQQIIDYRNKLRKVLAPMGINADDIDKVMLPNALKLCETCISMNARRRENYINDSSLSRETGITRKTLHDNKIYSKIIAYFRDEPVRKRDDALEAALQEIARLKACNNDFEASLRESLPLQTKLANVNASLEKEKREKEEMQRKMMQQASQIISLEQQINDYRKILESLRPQVIAHVAS